MPAMKKLFFQSVTNYIYLSLFLIIGIAMLSIFFSFWISEKADNDAKAINLSGSMRMQVFQIGLSLKTTPEKTTELIEKLDTTWRNSLFTSLREESGDDALNHLFHQAQQNWFERVKPSITDALENDEMTRGLSTLLTEQVGLTDQLVNQFQRVAESKIRLLRTLQFFALIITTLVGSLIFYLLKNRVEQPLRNLTDAAKRISQGEVEQHLAETGGDELAELARAFNQMSASISKTWSELENLVDERTQELQRNNTLLTFLFNTARATLDHEKHQLDYVELADKLANILGNHAIEFCLFTSEGDRPYLQAGANLEAEHCAKKSCYQCKGSAPFDTINPLEIAHKYPILYRDQQYGLISVRSRDMKALTPWQDKLLRSSADQVAIALSLHETKDQEHRLAMLNERTVIARELHDSLAQSLSYLQIQVTRLQKTHDKSAYDAQQAILDELREGLSSAYRHLRELLTTFRLKMDGNGLEGAMRQTLEQLRERSTMEVELDYAVKDLPLNPNEEIHLLQVAREASQNAINHSGGSTLRISLKQLTDKSIELLVEDNGSGLSDSPEKLNHYGLAIMQERSRHLDGNLKISNIDPHGTRICLRFTPMYLRTAA